LLGPLAFGLFATLTDRSAAVASGALVGLIGLGHLAWALGVPWPARDHAQLTAHVMPKTGPMRARSGGRFPSRAITLAVTLVFLGMSACLVAPEVVARVVPGVRWLVLAIAGIFALRGIVGLAYWTRRREAAAGDSPFFVYNRVLYSPGCLLIAALAAVSATSVP
jgi:hypothetical protein